MKKIITAALIALTISAHAQNIDTVKVASLTLQAQDWAYLVGSYNTTADSVTMVAYRQIRDKVQQAIPQSWTANMTVTNLPAKVVVDFYQMVKTAGAGEVVSRYTAITNAIAAKTEISYWIGFIDAAVLNDFNRKRDRGKNLLID